MRRSLIVAALVFAACPKSVPPAEETKPAEAPDAGSVEAQEAAAPKIDLPAPPDVPLTPPPLSDVDDSKENPTTAEKVSLGHQLFFDARLSKDDSKACVGCHLPEHGWASTNALDEKVGGAKNKRNAQTVVNLAYNSSYYWDGRKPTLESVIDAAWKGQLGADAAAIAVKLNANATYKALFNRAFKEDATATNIPQALAAFLRALKSGNAPWDRYDAGDKKAVSADAVKGFEVFKKSGCINCHVPTHYTDFDFHNVGVGANKPEADRDPGRKDATKKDDDFGKFKTPTLRNIAVTSPYFHDGSAKTLDDAIDYMSEGFAKSKATVDPKLKPAKLSKKDHAALKAFLESLTGEATFAGKPELP